MVPPVVGPEVPSEGEREIFRRLRDDAATKDWVVLHSLGVARHATRVAGEIDFVVIIPAVGVLCLEIKGCGTAALRRENGLWFYGPADHGDPRGPFRQASDAMHSLRREVLGGLPSLAAIQFSSGVVFPFARFDERSPEWQPWEVIDTAALRSAPVHRLLLALMGHARTHLLSVARPPRLDAGRPTPLECTAILSALRSNFEVPVDPPARRTGLEAELRKYTEEQIGALDAMAENPRALFIGPAGTGKTLLALEAARRARAEGRRVLLLCFNRLLGSWLGGQAATLRPEVTTRTLHQQLLAVSGMAEAPPRAGHEFWSSVLPEAACEVLLEAERDRWVYDEIIVDEAQDVFSEPYLDVLDLSLRGGLAAGRWRMFGDFENQAIFGAAGSNLESFRERRSGHAPVYRLRQNCRNTPLIAEYAQLLSGLHPRYQRVLRGDDGVQPVLRFHRSPREEEEQLIEVLSGLERAGFSDGEIVVLSPRVDSAAARVSAPRWRARLAPLSQAESAIRYGTVQAFKGLEAPAVVVTDIETIATLEARALFYIAATRPLQRLVILASERVREEAVRILSTGTGE
jgi:DNA polymerase III delta prime subunit